MAQSEFKRQKLLANGFDPNIYTLDDNGDVYETPPTTVSPPTSYTPLTPTTWNGDELSAKPKYTPLETAGKSFLHSLPTALGGAGGMAIGAALAPETFGMSLLLPLIGGLAGGYGARKLQETVEPEVWAEDVAAAQAENPLSGIAGEIATLPLAGFKPSPAVLGKAAGGAAKLLAKPFGAPSLLPSEANALINTSFGAGLGGIIPTAESLVTRGELPEAKDVVLNTILGGLFNEPNMIGRKLGFKPTNLNDNVLPVANTPGALEQLTGNLRREIQAKPEQTVAESVAAYGSPVERGQKLEYDTEGNIVARKPHEGMPIRDLSKKKSKGYVTGNFWDVAPDQLSTFEGEGGPVIESKPIVNKPTVTTGEIVPVEPAKIPTEISKELAALGFSKRQIRSMPLDVAVKSLSKAKAVLSEVQAKPTEVTPIPVTDTTPTTEVSAKPIGEQTSIVEKQMAERQLNRPEGDEGRYDEKNRLVPSFRLADGTVIKGEAGKAHPAEKLYQLYRKTGDAKYLADNTTMGFLDTETNRFFDRDEAASRFGIRYTTDLLQEEATPLTPFQKRIDEQLKANKINTTPTKVWNDIFAAFGAKRRNIKTEVDPSLEPLGITRRDPTDSLKEILVKINPEKQDLTTLPHEMAGHAFRHQLRNSKKAVDKNLINDFDNIVAQSDEFKTLNEARVKQGKEPWDPEEFIASEQGFEFLRRNLNLDSETPLKTWTKDFWSHIKTKYNKATPEEFRRVLQYRFQYDPAFHDYYKTGIKMPAVDVVDQSASDASEQQTRNMDERALSNPQTETPEFKKWFGDSKVVDENGKPLVVYHGTPNPSFDSFRTTGYKASSYQFGEGAYFSATPDRAVGYAKANRGGIKEGAGATYPVYVKLEKPYITSTTAATMDIGIKLAREKPDVYKSIAQDIADDNGYSSWDVVGTGEVGNRWLRHQGYDGVIYHYFKNPPDFYEVVAFHPEQIKSAIGNKGTFDPTNPDIRYQEEPALTKQQSSTRAFAPFLASRFDKIISTMGSNKTTEHVVSKLHSFAGDADRETGKIGNKMLLAGKGFKPEQVDKVYQHLFEMDANGTSDINLTEKEQAYAESITKILRDLREQQIAEGLLVKDEGGLRVAGIKPEGYMFNVLDSKVADVWANEPNSAEAKRYDELYIDHQIKSGVKTREEAEQLLEDYKQGFSAVQAPDVEFAALRRAEGNGLPWELVEKNFNHAAMRYARRAARDVSYYRWIQSDPSMRKALNIADQDGTRFKRGEGPEGIEQISSNDAVQHALRSVHGYTDLGLNPVVQSMARAVGSMIMGPGTAVRNLINLANNSIPYVKVSQIPLMAKALARINSSKVRAFENNAVRTSFQDYDAAGYYEGHPNPVVAWLDRFSSLMRKYQGRELSDKVEGEYLYALGELLATDNLANAKLGDKEAIRFVKKFSDLSKNDLLAADATVTPDDIEKMAKRFVDSTRGTYGPEGLPNWALEGSLQPFAALSRFSLEKSNTIWKDVVMPMKEGIYGPFIRYVLASMGVGLTIEQVNEMLSNKRGTEPTISEVVTSGDEKDLVSKAIATAQLASLAGIVSDGAQLASKTVQGKLTKYNQPLSFPMYSFVTDTLAKNFSDAVSALNEGEDPFQVAMELATAISTGSVQGLRYLDANFIRPEEQERKEKFRDYNIWQELTDRKDPSEVPSTDRFQNLRIKKFKKEDDVVEAGKMLPELMKQAMDKSMKNGRLNIELLQKELKKIRQNNYQTMPSPDEIPEASYEYWQHLVKTQGKEAAQARLVDYMRQREINKIKTSMVPSL